MAQIEKTVFISYRRSDVYTALAVYQDLKNQGYDVFFDYRSISSGDFEQIITSNIRARAHFILILTPTALDRCNEPGDWLRREIETAIDDKRNIVPLFFRGFRFGVSSKSGMSRLLRFDKPQVLTGKLKDLSRYNGLNVHEDYFDEAMHRLRNEYLNKPLDTVLHPVSNTVQRIVKEEQIAADMALEQIENVQELVKIAEEKPAREREAPQPIVSQVAAGDAGKRPRAAPQKPSAEKTPRLLPDRKGLASRFNLRVLLGIGALLVVASLAVAAFPALRNLFAPGVGSTKNGKDGMTLLYVPAGEFTMGNDYDSGDEKPVHTVTLAAFWIDQTEVTNKMYSQCVEAGACNEPTNTSSYTHSSYYGNSEFDDYPVIYVNWNMAKTYCEWADRRLPTEAEWEKAARWNPPLPQGEGGGEGEAFVYPWGDTFDGRLVNFCDTNCSFDWSDRSSDDGFADVAPVRSYPNGASPSGAYDMAGNVWEWVADWYNETYYANSPASNPLGPDSGQIRALRGGSWNYINYEVRSTRRGWNDPSNSDYNLGFRCAVSVDEQARSSTSQPITTEASTPSSALGIGSTMTGEDGMTLLYVPAGEFMMGSESYDNEKPIHPIYLDAFWIDKTEVTNAKYAKCMDADVCEEPVNKISSTRSSYYGNAEFDNYPVIYVDWNGAKTYCEWAGRRVPTEAEWEKAARGENANVYPWGNDAPNNNLLNYNGAVGDTTEVGSYLDGASVYGALDMAGNVWEWVNDWHSETYYSSSPSSNPEGPSSGQNRVLRGGAWGGSGDGVRSANRVGSDPTYTNLNIGFRCAMSATQ